MQKIYLEQNPHARDIDTRITGYAEVWYSTQTSEPVPYKFFLQEGSSTDGISIPQTQIIKAQKATSGPELAGDYSNLRFAPTVKHPNPYFVRGHLFNGSEVIIGTRERTLNAEGIIFPQTFVAIKSETEERLEETAKKLQLPLEVLIEL